MVYCDIDQLRSVLTFARIKILRGDVQTDQIVNSVTRELFENPAHNYCWYFIGAQAMNFWRRG